MSAPDRAHRSAVRTAGFTLAAATAVSLGGNVMHAATLPPPPPIPLWFALGWAAVPPLALPLAVHLAGTLGRATTGKGRGTVVVGVAATALLAFGISFYALRDLTLTMGYPPPVAVAVPVLIDVLAALATAGLLVLDRPAASAAEPITAPAPIPEPAPAPPADPIPVATEPTPPTTALTSADVHTMPDAAAGDPVPAAGVATDSAGVDADALRVAAGLVDRGVVRADPAAVAAAVAGLVAGESRRAVARVTGLHRGTVDRIASAVKSDALAA